MNSQPHVIDTRATGARNEYGEIPGCDPGLSSWETLTRKLAIRAIRLQVEKEARAEQRTLDEAELRRRCAVKAAEVSPFIGIVQASRKLKAKGLLERLLRW